MKIAVIGQGRIGKAVCALLRTSSFFANRVEIVTFSNDEDADVIVDFSVKQKKRDFKEFDVLINALPSKFYHDFLGSISSFRGVYLDFTEDNDLSRAAIHCCDHHKARSLTQCGVAPGLTVAVASEIERQSQERLYNIELMVGALAKNTINLWKYHPTWSMQGVLDEYSRVCEVRQGDRVIHVPSLDGDMTLNLNGKDYEAFYTSGGLGSFCHVTNAENCSYRSIRPKGHLPYAKFLIRDLGITDKTASRLEKYATRDDYVIFFARSEDVKGKVDQYVWEFDSTQILTSKPKGLTSIETVTAYDAVASLAMVMSDGKSLPQHWDHTHPTETYWFMWKQFGQLPFPWMS